MKKKITAIVLFAMMLICMLPITAKAGSITYNTNDRDKLKSFLETEVSGKKNGEKINPYAYNADDPTTWTGVTWSSDSYDKRVTRIEWSNKGLSGSLDLSGFTGLTYVDVSRNSINSINTTGDAALTELNCNYNYTALKSLNLTGNTSLSKLYCDRNGLTSLNTADAGTSLTILDCGNNAITSLDLSANTSLQNITCYFNQITSLNVSGFTSLTNLECSGNNIVSLDITGCTALKYLKCYRNALTSIDVSDSTALVVISCQENQLTALNLSGLTSLRSLYCEQNQLTALDVSDNPLVQLQCFENKLTSIDVTGKVLLEDLECEDNNISELDLSDNPLLDYLSCDNNNLTSLDLSANTAITYLYCEGNNLKSLDLSANPLMDVLMCADNPLKEITAKIAGADISIKAVGKGYVELLSHDHIGFYAKAYPITPYAFINWTEASAEVGTALQYDLTSGVDYTLTANFEKGPELTLIADPVNGKIYTGGRIKITPSLEGGTWDFDSNYFSRDGETFTAVKAGTVRVSYTADDQTKYVDVTISETLLPQTGQDYTPIYALIALAGLMLIAGIGLSIYASKKAI